jgi:hypothetical protein
MELLDDVCHMESRFGVFGDCGGINPYTLTARLGPGGLAHHEDSPRLDPAAWSFMQGNKTW